MNYNLEIKKLAPEIQDILLSFFGAKINLEIAEKNKLNPDQLGRMIDLTNDVYLKVFDVNNLKDKLSQNLNLPPNRAEALALDVAGLKLLIADNYFDGAIAKYISANRGHLEEYKQRVLEEEKYLKEERAVYQADLADMKVAPEFLDLEDGYDEAKMAAQEKIDAVALFKEDIKNVLNAKSEAAEVIAIYNESLINLIKNDNLFRRSLESALYNNSEVLTPGKISLNGTEVSSTTANWLKDFISENGSEMFSNVTLVKYLAGSHNVQRLIDSDRELIKKVLKLYRNLAFFPDSMENVPLDEWEIFPVERESFPRSASRVNDVLGEETETENSLAETKPDSEPPLPKKEATKPDFSGNSPSALDTSVRVISESVAPTNRPVVSTAPTVPVAPAAPSELDELQAILNKYAPGTFEYKTIQQEINRLKRKK